MTALLLLHAVGVAAVSELQSPSVGSVMTWTCEGSFTREYRVRVKRIKNEIVYYDGSEDGRAYQVQKPTWLTGTTLWTKKNDNGFQWMDKEDFRGFTKLQAGARFKSAVPIQLGDEKWVWNYLLTVGQPKRTKHPVLGNVELVPLSEKRRVYHGDYWSNMTSLVAPALGITVSWVWEDPRGQEECELTEFREGKK
jgi:hypothetical protein